MIAFTNVIELLAMAAEGKALKVISATEQFNGIRLEPAKDRFFDGDVISDTNIYGTIKSAGSVTARAVYVKSVKALMDIALNVTPVIRAGQTLAWDLDNTDGKLYICPVKAKQTLANMNLNIHSLNT